LNIFVQVIQLLWQILWAVENDGKLTQQVLDRQKAQFNSLSSQLLSIKAQNEELTAQVDDVLTNQKAALVLLQELQQLIPPPQEPAGFIAQLVLNPQGENMALPKKAAKVTANLQVNDDGSMTPQIQLLDTEGLPITTLTAWPSAVAQPTVTPSDTTPGPSAWVVAPIAPPTPSTANPGFFDIATVTPVTPATPGAGQNTDFPATIASGLTGQTSPITEDCGTASVVADASKPGGFAGQLSTQP
jgi:hypothetical protein